MQGELIRREHNGTVIFQRADGAMNMTALGHAGGKKAPDYLRLKETKAFLQELSLETGIPVSSLVEVKRGKPDGDPSNQGTWGHKLVIYNYSQWLSPAIAVQVSLWLDELHTTGRVSLRPEADTSSALTAIVTAMTTLVARMERLEAGAVKPYGPTAPLVKRFNELLAIYDLKPKEAWKRRRINELVHYFCTRGVQLAQEPVTGLISVPCDQMPYVENELMFHIRNYITSQKPTMFDDKEE